MKIELLSPAGDLEKLKIAFLYGADAVYIGGKNYSLRANANNFSLSEIREACSFAHKINKKVYLAINIIFHNEDIKGIKEYIKEVVQAGIDAFIVSEAFLIDYIVTNYPQVEVHVSTQNSITNYEAVNLLKEKKVKRVVLARELHKKEIKKIIDKTGLDIEIFIHGAMCTFYSGRCTLSNYQTNRDANRGGCSQVCRFMFEMENHNQPFTMALKDLNLSNKIKDMIAIGVKSLKIEGRMRSVYYLATVNMCYRQIIDGYINKSLTNKKLKELENSLKLVANRETSNHYFDHDESFQDHYYQGRTEFSNQDFLALVLNYNKKTKICTLTQRNYFKVGDEVEFFTPKHQIINYKIEEIYNKKNKKIEIANHPEEIIKLKIDIELEPYSMMRIKQNRRI